MVPRVDAKVRRGEIIAAALRCLERFGYRGTTMDAIVAESGLSKGSLYWHFKNKKDIFLALFDHLMVQSIQEFEPLLAAEMAPADKLRMILGAISQLAEHELDAMSIPLNLLTELLTDKDFLTRYQKAIGVLADAVRALIEAGIAAGDFRPVDAQEVAWALMAVYDGLLFYHILDMPGDTLRQSALMADVIVAGLKSL